MKNLIKLGFSVAVGLALALTPTVSKATGFYESFQATNALTGSTTASLTTYGTNIISWPTNSLGTNGFGYLTGHQIACFNQDHFGFRLQGWLTNAATAVIGVSLCFSMKSDVPQITTNSVSDTNNVYSGPAGSFGQNDWSQNIYYIPISIPAYTNWFDWETNIQATSILGDVNFVGIYQITNNFAAGAYITNKNNSLFGINKKIRPVQLSN